MRRKYQNCTVRQTAAGFELTLDDKPMRTPAGVPLIVPSRALADAIAAEWNAVADKQEIKPQMMPMTRLTATALDRVPTQHNAVIADTAAYGRTDLLCYRAERPIELVARQNAGWNPWLDWAKARYGATLAITEGVMPVAQDEAMVGRLREAVAGFDAFALAGLANLTAMLGSVVLALAVLESELSVENAIALAEIDAVFQAERWGEDSFATKRRHDVRRDITEVGKFLALFR